MNPDASPSALSLSGGVVYAAGYFSHIGGATRYNLAALDPATGMAPPGIRQDLTRFLSRCRGHGVHGRSLQHHERGSRATAWQPSTPQGRARGVPGDGTVLVWPNVALVRGTGLLTSAGGVPRSNIAALDAASGMVLPWAPEADNWVASLAVRGNTVYVGGGFYHIGGSARQNLAALDAGTGAATAWRLDANGYVLALAASESTVYAGGGFTAVGGVARARLAALDARTGAVTAWDPGADDFVNVILASGNTVYAGGDFHHVGGSTRNRIAAIDATSGAATSWDPNADFVVDAIAVSGNTVYAAGGFTHIGGSARSHLAALDATSGTATAWAPEPDGWASALAVSGNTVYVGGTFTSVAGAPRTNIAALDETTGAALDWMPSADSGVYALALSDSTVLAGGVFTTVLGFPQQGVACLHGWSTSPPDEVVTAVAITRLSPNPAHREALIEFALPSAGHVRVSVHDLQGRVVARLVDEQRPAGGIRLSGPAERMAQYARGSISCASKRAARASRDRWCGSAEERRRFPSGGPPLGGSGSFGKAALGPPQPSRKRPRKQ